MKHPQPFIHLNQIFLSKASGVREEAALEGTMQSLALDQRTPIALELAATANSQRFLLRAPDTVAQRHLTQQIQARYPQVRIAEAQTDPLALQEDEECSVVELRPGAAMDLPLRSWNPRELLAEGTDPLLGLLAACQHLPEQIRVVTQLTLLPASPTWSAEHRRRAVEHPLAKEQERARERRSTPQPAGLIPLFLVVLLLVFCRVHPVPLPAWLTQAGSALLHGHALQLTVGQIAELLAGSVALLILCAVITLGATMLQRVFGGGKLYDQRLVAEKTALPAYRARLRLVAITTLPPRQPGNNTAPQAPQSPSSSAAQASMTPREQRRQQRQKRRAEQSQARQRERERRERLRMLTAAYHQYHLAAGGFFRAHHLSRRRAQRTLQIASGQRAHWLLRWWMQVRFSRHLLSVADLAALWHLPQPHDLANLSHLEPAQSRTLPAPPVLTTGDGYTLGFSSHAGQRVPVFLPVSSLRQNMLVVASTGKGKSNLFFLLAQAYLHAKATGTSEVGGLLCVDPHGDLVDLLLGCLPPDLEDLVEVIDLADRAFPVGLNPLDLSGGQERDKIVDNVVQLVAALWDLDEAPRTRNVLEYACKTLAEVNLALLKADPQHGPERQYTLLDVVPLLRQDHFRHALMEHLDNDPILRDWWNDYYEQLGGLQADFSSSVVTRLSKFASSYLSRRMLGQSRSTLDLAALVRQEKILLIKGASGEVGSDLATLMVSLLVGLFQVTLAEQVRLAPEQRHRFLVLIDEFQMLAGVDYQTMLAELRKYGGTFALATQSLAYLDHLDHRDRTLRATVLSNIDHLFAFAMSADDARLLHLDGVEPEDITGLSDYECYVRLSLGGRRLPLFSLHLQPAPQPDAQQQQRVRERSQRRAGRRSVEDVELLLQEGRARQRILNAEKKDKRNKRGEYDAYAAVLNPVPENERGRGERKRAGGKQGMDASASTAGHHAKENSPRHVLLDPDPPQSGEDGVVQHVEPEV